MGLKLLNLSALKLEVPEISVRSSSQVLLLSGPLGVFPTPVCIRHQERPGVEFIAGFRALPWWLPSIGTPFLFQLLLKCSPEPPSSSKDGCRFFFFLPQFSLHLGCVSERYFQGRSPAVSAWFWSWASASDQFLKTVFPELIIAVCQNVSLI